MGVVYVTLGSMSSLLFFHPNCIQCTVGPLISTAHSVHPQHPESLPSWLSLKILESIHFRFCKATWLCIKVVLYWSILLTSQLINLIKETMSCQCPFERHAWEGYGSLIYEIYYWLKKKQSTSQETCSIWIKMLQKLKPTPVCNPLKPSQNGMLHGFTRVDRRRVIRESQGGSVTGGQGVPAGGCQSLSNV